MIVFDVAGDGLPDFSRVSVLFVSVQSLRGFDISFCCCNASPLLGWFYWVGNIPNSRGFIDHISDLFLHLCYPLLRKGNILLPRWWYN